MGQVGKVIGRLEQLPIEGALGIAMAVKGVADHRARSDDEVDTTRRETIHSAKLDVQPRDRAIEFGAPAWTPPVISYSGGDGSSPEQAIIITIQGLTHIDAAVSAEMEWSREKYPGRDWDDRSKVTKGGKRYDLMRFTLANGESKTVYFDVTGFSDE